MPSIKPIKKLANQARDLRDSHRVRHSPTGFGFALADSVEYLDSGTTELKPGDNEIQELTRTTLTLV